MKIVVASDCHGDFESIKKIQLLIQDADYYRFLGDSELDSSLLSPFISVKGNNDFFLNYPIYKDITIQNVKFHLEHGTTLNKYNIEKRVESTLCDVFLFGHTHRRFAQKFKDVLILNPGSTSLPRDGKEGSFLLITFTTKEDLKYEFIPLR